MTLSNRQRTSSGHLLLRGLLRGLFILCIAIFSGAVGIVSTAHAAIVCQQMTEVAQEKPQIQALALSETQVVWRTKKAIRRYDIAAQTIHTIAENVLSRKYEYFVETNGDSVIWTDADNRIYLHTISTGDTIKISRGEVTSHHPLIDSGYIVYARPKKSSAYDGPYRLVVYEIATGLTIRVAASAYEDWDLDSGRVVYHDKTQAYLYDITSGLTDVITTREAVYSASIDGQRMIYMAGIPKSYDGDDWLSHDVFLYDLDTQTHTQVTDADYYTRIYGMWIDDASDTIVWGEVYELLDSNDVYLYDILTGAVNLISTPGLKHYERFEPEEIDGRFIGALDIYYDPTLSRNYVRAAVYDRVTSTILPLNAAGYNSGDNVQLASGQIAWVATFSNSDQVVTQSAVYLSAGCASSPNIRKQSQSGDVLSGRPRTLSVEVTGDQPIAYQWYQGEAGDTALPVGENSPTYTTTDITTLVSYWVRMTNPVGSTDSQTITLSPAESYQLVRNEGFEIPLNKLGGLWDDHWIDSDFPKTQRICNTTEKIVAFEGECAYRFGKPLDKYVYTGFHYIDQDLTLPQLEVGDVLTVSAYVNSVNASHSAFITLRLFYEDAPYSELTLNPALDTDGYVLATNTLTLTSTNIAYLDLFIGYPGKKGRIFFDAVTVVASAGEAAPVLLPVPDVPGDLRRGDSSLSN